VATAAEIYYVESLVEVLIANQVLTAYNASSPEAAYFAAFAELYSKQEQQFLMTSVLVIPDAIQIFLITAAKLMVLDRMAHAAISTSRGMPARWATAERIVMGVIVVLNLAACCFSAAASFYSAQRMAPSRNAAAAFAAEDLDLGLQYAVDVDNWTDRSYVAQAGADYCQAFACLFVVVTFLLAAAVCARRIQTILRLQPHADAGSLVPNLSLDVKRVWRQIVGVCFFVFVAFVLLSFRLTLMAVAEYGATDDDCPVESAQYCDPCYNTYSLIQQWYFFTPEFDILCTLISSPIALLFTLRGMGTNRLLQMLKQQGRLVDSKTISWLK
jgi:hypothetical protein